MLSATEKELEFRGLIDEIISEGIPQFQEQLFELTGEYVAKEVSDVKLFLIWIIGPRLQTIGIDVTSLPDTWAGYNGIRYPYSVHLSWFKLLRWVMNHQKRETEL